MKTFAPGSLSSSLSLPFSLSSRHLPHAFPAPWPVSPFSSSSFRTAATHRRPFLSTSVRHPPSGVTFPLSGKTIDGTHASDGRPTEPGFLSDFASPSLRRLLPSLTRTATPFGFSTLPARDRRHHGASILFPCETIAPSFGVPVSSARTAKTLISGARFLPLGRLPSPPPSSLLSSDFNPHGSPPLRRSLQPARAVASPAPPPALSPFARPTPTTRTALLISLLHGLSPPVAVSPFLLPFIFLPYGNTLRRSLLSTGDHSPSVSLSSRTRPPFPPSALSSSYTASSVRNFP